MSVKSVRVGELLSLVGSVKAELSCEYCVRFICEQTVVVLVLGDGGGFDLERDGMSSETVCIIC